MTSLFNLTRSTHKKVSIGGWNGSLKDLSMLYGRGDALKCGTKSLLETKRQRPFHMADTLGEDELSTAWFRKRIRRQSALREKRDAGGVAVNPFGMVSEFTGPLEK